MIHTHTPAAHFTDMAASADEYMKKAEGKATAFFFKDLDGAYDLYIKAAGVYKADKNWRSAGNAFMKAGDTSMALKNPGDACSAYTDCAKCLKRVDMKGAKAAMEQACKLVPVSTGKRLVRVRDQLEETLRETSHASVGPTGARRYSISSADDELIGEPSFVMEAGQLGRKREDIEVYTCPLLRSDSIHF